MSDDLDNARELLAQALNGERRHRAWRLDAARTFALIAVADQLERFYIGGTAMPDAPQSQNNAQDYTVPETDETLYYTIRRKYGPDALPSAVTNFYHRVLADPQLAHYFERTDMEHLQRHMMQFLVQATGGPRQYSGRAMERAHFDLRIIERDFDRVAWHLQQTLLVMGVAEEDAGAVLALVAPLREAVTAGSRAVAPDPA